MPEVLDIRPETDTLDLRPENDEQLDLRPEEQPAPEPAALPVITPPTGPQLPPDWHLEQGSELSQFYFPKPPGPGIGKAAAQLGIKIQQREKAQELNDRVQRINQYFDAMASDTGNDVPRYNAVRAAQRLALAQVNEEASAYSAPYSVLGVSEEPFVEPIPAEDYARYTGLKGKAAKIAAGLQQTGASLLEMFHDPFVLGGLGFGKVAPEAARVIGNAFGLQMLASAPGQVAELYQNWKKGDVEATTRSLASLGASLTAGPALLKHGGMISETPAELLRRNVAELFRPIQPEPKAATPYVRQTLPEAEAEKAGAVTAREAEKSGAEPQALDIQAEPEPAPTTPVPVLTPFGAGTVIGQQHDNSLLDVKLANGESRLIRPEDVKPAEPTESVEQPTTTEAQNAEHNIETTRVHGDEQIAGGPGAIESARAEAGAGVGGEGIPESGQGPPLRPPEGTPPGGTQPVSEVAPAEPAPATTIFDPSRVPTVEFPVERIKLSEDVPNFKADANPETGVVRGQELAGKYERIGTAPIVLWQRLNGDTEIITGRHRLDLARRSGEKTIPAQIVSEAAGFTKENALTFDAEANIRDGQGAIEDYAHYFRNSPQISESEARARGLLSRAKGKDGWSLGRLASDDLYALWAADKIKTEQALAIARAAPGNPDLQQLGIRQAAKGKSGADIENFIKVVQAETGGGANQMDMFGRDDTAMRRAEELAGRASSFQQEIQDQIRAVQSAAKRPEAAAKLGVDVKDPAAVLAKVADLKSQAARWANWSLHPDLVSKVKGESVAEPPKTVASPSPSPGSDLFGSETPFNLAAERASVPEPAAEPVTETPRLSQEEMFNLDKLFEEKDPSKSANAAQAMYGGPAKAAEVLERQLRVLDTNKDFKKQYGKEQRARLGEVVALLRQRGGEVTHGLMGRSSFGVAVAQDLARLRGAVAPQTAGGPARFAGNLLRELTARSANEMARADRSLRPFRNDFDRTIVPKDWKYDPAAPLPRNLAFIDAYESGNTGALSAGEQKAAAEFHRLNQADLDRVHALGTGALQTFYQNYFPHIWDDPKRAASVFGKLLSKSPIEGPKSFLKKRTFSLFKEGLAAGLKPVHDNPVDLWLLKKREVERYILGQSFVKEMRKAGQMQFKYVFNKLPDGWAVVNDRAFQVYGPPTVPVKEAFDAGMRQATLNVLGSLGVPAERVARLGREWGQEVHTAGTVGQERIKTKFGGPEFVVWHELGHVLDNRYPELRTRMRDWALHEPLGAELKALAEARTGPMDSAAFKRYVQTVPEKMAVILQAYVHAPELMDRIAPLVKKEFDIFIDHHPELYGIREIRPTLQLGEAEGQVSHGGLLRLGDYIMPEQAARVVNNYLSPGLNPHLWYRTLRQTSNLLNGVQLGLSAFHLGFTSLDAATSRLAVALEDVARGKVGEALKTAASVPVSPFTNIRTGAKLRAEVLSPGAYPQMAKLARALEQAGGRVGQDAFWQTEFTRRMIRAWHKGGLQWATLPLRAPLALWEQTMRPILEYVVPRQKLGVFADMARRELLNLGPDAAPDATREALRKAWDSVDNRMGQVVYDNLFYNRAVKDVALLTFRAYGWQLGKYREGLGAVSDVAQQIGKLKSGQAPELTHRMAYAMALPLMVGTIGGALHYLLNGQPPQTARDYFQPRTGETDNNGNPVRLNLPSYIKDVIAYGKHPVTSVAHSLNPLISALFDLLGNKDFYNVQIRNPQDPLLDQASEVAKFAAKQFMPFSVSGAKQMRDDAAPVWKQIGPFFGITPVPQRLTMTPAQELASEIMAAGAEVTTQAQFDRKQAIRDAVKQIQRGQPVEGMKALAEGLDKQTLAPNSAEMLIKRLRYTPLQFQVSAMTPDAALRVWGVANDQEKQALRGILLAKIAKARSLWPAEKVKMIEQAVGMK